MIQMVTIQETKSATININNTTITHTNIIDSGRISELALYSIVAVVVVVATVVVGDAADADVVVVVVAAVCEKSDKLYKYIEIRLTQ